jgi:hypothetical protein
VRQIDQWLALGYRRGPAVGGTQDKVDADVSIRRDSDGGRAGVEVGKDPTKVTGAHSRAILSTGQNLLAALPRGMPAGLR